MNKLETTYLGLKLKNPVIAASSGLTSNLGRILDLEKAGAAAVVLKSLFEEQITNEVSHLIRLDAQNTYPEAEDYMRNYIRQHSVEAHLDLLRKTKKAVAVPVIASINCVNMGEWTNFAREFELAGADALELNLFVVPTGKHESPDQIEKRYTEVVAQVTRMVRIPVSVKIGFYFTNLIAMAEKLVGAGAKGIVLFNRFYEPDINIHKLEMISSEIFSSPSDIRRSLRWIGLVNAAIPGLEIAASTGIHDGEAVIKMLLAGAQVTQLCSTVYIHGAQVIPDILSGLEAFMDKWNFDRLTDFRGRLSYNNIPDPMLYERAQFMKYFSQGD